MARRAEGEEQRGLCRSSSENRGWNPPASTGRGASKHLDEAGDGAAAGLIQEQGAEDVIEEGRVVPAGPLTVRVEIHL